MLQAPRSDFVMDAEKIDELLECSICLERLAEDSKVLPCQHTFCKQCLENIHQTKRELRCPECRILVTVPLDELPNNILLARLLEGMKIHGLKLDAVVDWSAPASHTASANKGPPGGPWTATKPNTPLQRVTPTPKQPWAKALYTYEGTETGDLSFRKGDVILLRAQIDENWYQGEISGKIGAFPISYVQVAVPLQENLPKCKALYNFDVSDSNEKDCLKFKKDQILTVIRRVDENWAEGMLSDKIGIFPITFVEMNDAVRRLMNKSAKSVITQENDLNAERKISNLAPQSFGSCEHLPLNMVPSLSASGAAGCHSSAETESPRLCHSPADVSAASLTPPPTVVRRGKSSDATSCKRFSLDVSALTSMQATSSSSPNAQQPHQHQQQQHRLSADLPPSTSLQYMNELGASSASGGQLGAASAPRLAGHSPSAGNSRELALSPTTPSGHRLGPPPSEPPPPPPALYVALYHYAPAKDDELELVKGEYYTVVEKCQDGWYKGSSLQTGRLGVFPGNYVQFGRSPKPVGGANSPAVSGLPSPISQLEQQRTPLPRAPHQSRSSPQPVVSQSQIDCVSEQVPPVAARQPLQIPPQPLPPPPHRPALTRSLSHKTEPPPQIVPRTTSSHIDRHERAARRNSAPIDRIQLRPLPPPPVVRLDAVPPPPKVVPKKHVTHLRPNMESGGSRVMDITPPNVTMETASIQQDLKKKDKERSSFMKRFKSGKHGRSKGSSGHIFTVSQDGNFVRIGHIQPLPNAAPAAAATTATAATGKVIAKMRSSGERYRCHVPYPRQTDVELDLAMDDIVTVHKKREDGWFKGTLERTGRTGLFPGSFVEPL